MSPVLAIGCHTAAIEPVANPHAPLIKPTPDTTWMGAPDDLLGPSPTFADYQAVLYARLDAAQAWNEVPMDVCNALIYTGDVSSVPHLIRVLKLFPGYDHEPPPDKPVSLVDTQQACVSALRRITGEKVGYAYVSWKAWWEKNHPDQPLEELPNKAVQPTAGAPSSRPKVVRRRLRARRG